VVTQTKYLVNNHFPGKNNDIFGQSHGESRFTTEVRVCWTDSSFFYKLRVLHANGRITYKFWNIMVPHLKNCAHTHTHTHKNIYIYIYI